MHFQGSIKDFEFGEKLYNAVRREGLGGCPHEKLGMLGPLRSSNLRANIRPSTAFLPDSLDFGGKIV